MGTFTGKSIGDTTATGRNVLVGLPRSVTDLWHTEIPNLHDNVCLCDLIYDKVRQLGIELAYQSVQYITQCVNGLLNIL